MQPVANLQNAIATKTALLVQIDENLAQLKKAFKKDPETIEPATLLVLLKQLKEANAEIEDRLAENKQKWIGTTCGQWSIKVLLVSTVLLSIVSTILGIWLAVLTNSNKTQQRLAIGFTAISGAATISQFSYGYLTRIEDAHDQFQREERFKKHFTQEQDLREERFFNLIASLVQLKNADDPARSKVEFRNCLKSLSEMPDEKLKNIDLPPKPLWVESTTKILKKKNPEDDLTKKLDSGMEKIAKGCHEKRPFTGEQSGHGVIFEPIESPNEAVKAEFAALEDILGCKLPYISLNNKLYSRDGKIFDTIEAAEAHTAPAHTVINLT